MLYRSAQSAHQLRHAAISQRHDGCAAGWHYAIDPVVCRTGHGVGAFLNVHEGPNGISKRVSEPLEPGMVTSIEPGFYKSGWGGIRIENLYIVKSLTPKDDKPDAATKPDPNKIEWYGFESLTYIPFDQRLIDRDRLDARQREWLQQYNAAIVEKLSPTLSPAEVEWLQAVCTL